MTPDALTRAIEDERAASRRPALSFAPTAPERRPLKVYIGSAYGRYLEPDHIQSLMRLLRHPVMFAPTWNDAAISRARSKTATHFLTETDYDVHVSIDSDIVFDPESVFQIAQQAHDLGGLVAGLYVTRAGGKFCRPTSIFETDVPIEFGTDPTPVPIKWAATGFLATPRKVFERLAQDLPLCHGSEPWKFYPFYGEYAVPPTREGGDTIWLSEDFALCDRARKAGFGVYLNPSIRLLHLGQHPFRLEDLAQPERPPVPVRMTYQADGRYRYEVADTTGG